MILQIGYDMRSLMYTLHLLFIAKLCYPPYYHQAEFAVQLPTVEHTPEARQVIGLG
jgi:hypothetical protein